MTTYRITTRTSVSTTANGDHAFDSNSPGADTLIVDPGAFLIAKGASSSGAVLLGDSWTATIHGSVIGTFAGLNANGFGNPLSIITIGSDGYVHGDSWSLFTSYVDVRNYGSIDGDVLLGAGTNVLTNMASGEIDGMVRVGSGSTRIANLGIIHGSIDLTNSVGVVTNGGIIDGDILGGDYNQTIGTDTITNYTFDGTSYHYGIVTGVISLGEGNDRFNGGLNGETLADGSGADTYYFYGGNDLYKAPDESANDRTDYVDGGTGIDTYDLHDGGALHINLDTVAHAEFGMIAASTATGTSVAPAGYKDIVVNFENVLGGGGQDVIYGSVGANSLSGGAGIDEIYGYGGADTINGGTEVDDIAGGGGKDLLTGGAGDDNFYYFARSDSGATKATRDVVTDFQSGSDQIVLVFDNNTTNAAGTIDNHAWLGTNVNFTGHAGELRAYWAGAGQVVELDVNGDALADFAIEFADPTHAIHFTAADFI